MLPDAGGGEHCVTPARAAGDSLFKVWLARGSLRGFKNLPENCLKITANFQGSLKLI